MQLFKKTGLICIFLCKGLLLFAGKNILLNSGFEDIVNGFPANWEIDSFAMEEGTSTYRIDSEPARTGKYCLTIENIQPNDARVIQHLKIKPRTLYRFSCYVKTVGIGAEGVGASICTLEIFGSEIEQKDTGGQWKYIEFYGRTVTWQQEIKVAVRLGGFGSAATGKASFDDLKVEAVGSVPEGTKVFTLTMDAMITTDEDYAKTQAAVSPLSIIAFCVFIGIILALIFLNKYKKQMRIFKNVLIMIASGIITLLVIELVMGFLNIRAAYPQKEFIKSPDFFKANPSEGLPWEPAPNAGVTLKYFGPRRSYFDENNSITIQYNSEGFRDYEYPVQKPPGVFRIVGIGDSFTEGEGVKFEDVYLKQLEQQLQTEKGAGKYEVINLARSGQYLDMNHAILKDYGMRYTPDIVLVNYILNDLHDFGIKDKGYDIGEADLISQEFTTYKMDSAPPFSALWDFIDGKLRLLNITRQTIQYYNLLHSPENGASWDEFSNIMQSMKTELAAVNCKLVVVVWPMLFNLKHYPLAPAHNAIHGALERLDIPYLDLTAPFSKYPTEKLIVHITDYHPNEVAHKLTAELVYAFLVEKKLLP